MIRISALRAAALAVALVPRSYIGAAHAAPVSSNDDIENAILITGPSFTDKLETSAATTAADDPDCAASLIPKVSAWTGGPLPVEFKREPRLKIDVHFQDGLLDLDGQARYSAELNCSLPAQVNLSLALIQKTKDTSVAGTFDLGPISCSGQMFVFLGPIAADDGVFVPGNATVEALVSGTTIVGAIPYEDEVVQKIKLTTLTG